ncbi:OmpP1/FadL family transporter [Roseovarius pelagicus]|uniref:Outer membrane protein transport protein n=1 Tax=Roseovarius pelagicus TaxID=2980108 RepID=A0ABY6D8S5_9RHOB|nr:outer membrane protein transport protein [Roseovarius pelagicus]UXX82526.1 outer membrane protein transport protein [Roseovarius pelagicus]
MKSSMLTASFALALTLNPAYAGNLDRTKTPIDIIFEQGSYAELSFGFAMPSVTGVDSLGNAISNVGADISAIGAGLKLQLSDHFSLAIIYDQPYGVDLEYGGNPATTLLGGTMAKAESDELKILFRYGITDRIAVYGGPRIVGADGNITLSGLAYGGLNGYNARFSSDQGLGYVLGAAYEIPEIAFRAALTYHSEVELNMQTTETFPGGAPAATGSTKSTLPQSVKLQVQSGVAQNTLLFGSIRWSEWSVFTLNPPSPAPNLASMVDAWTYEIGVGYRFSDKFSASVTYSYEDEEGNNLVSPLAPNFGNQSLTLGGKYQVTDQLSLAGGVKYTWLGDAFPVTNPPNTPRASFSNNDAISVGVKIGMSF